MAQLSGGESRFAPTKEWRDLPVGSDCRRDVLVTSAFRRDLLVRSANCRLTIHSASSGTTNVPLRLLLRRDLLVRSANCRLTIHFTSAGMTSVPLQAGVTSTPLRAGVTMMPLRLLVVSTDKSDAHAGPCPSRQLDRANKKAHHHGGLLGSCCWSTEKRGTPNQTADRVPPMRFTIRSWPIRREHGIHGWPNCPICPSSSFIICLNLVKLLEIDKLRSAERHWCDAACHHSW